MRWPLRSVGVTSGGWRDSHGGLVPEVDAPEVSTLCGVRDERNFSYRPTAAMMYAFPSGEIR